MKQMLKTVIVTATIIGTPTLIFSIVGVVISNLPWPIMHEFLKDSIVVILVSAAVATIGILALRRIEDGEILWPDPEN